MQPLISVIVPVYNVAEYLPRCMESILGQSYRNLEIILINDGSTDGSGLMCDEFAQRDSRIVVIHQENAGVSAARNAGLDVASGEWIGFVDSDDYIDHGMYERLRCIALKNDTKISACGFVKIHLDSHKEYRVCHNINEILTQKEALIYLMSDRYYEGYVWNKLFHSSLFACERFDSGLYYCEDLLIVTRLLLKTDGLAYSPTTLYHYNHRQANITNTFNERRLTDLEAREQVIAIVDTISSDISKLAKCYYTHAAIGIMYASAKGRNYRYMSVLRKKALSFWEIYFFSSEISFRYKVRSFMILTAPKLAYESWRKLKLRFGINYW